MSIDLDEFDTPQKPDFQRANGAPMVMDAEGKRHRLSRPSNYAKALDDESALTNWRIDTACSGVAHDSALQARYVALLPDDRQAKQELREAAIQAGRGSEAADIGTALHAMSERFEKEPDWEPPEPYLSSLKSYRAEMARLGLVSDLYEYAVVNWTYRAAGTADRLYRTTAPLVTPNGEILPTDTLLVGDLKTGKTLQYSAAAYAAQLAVYAGGKMYDVVHDTEADTPEVNQDWAIIMHMPSNGDTCEALWVDLQAGHWGCYLAQQVKLWRSNWRRGEFALSSVISPELLEMGELIDLVDADAEWVRLNAEWCTQRLDQIKESPEARKRLQILWPDTVPVKEFRGGTATVEQMLEGMKLLSRIEAEYELQFITGAPTTGIHAGDITNIPPSHIQMELLAQEAQQ